MASHTVIFSPLHKKVSVETDATLLEAAAKADLVISNLCGGDGICGLCKMIVRKGTIRGGGTPLLTREEIRRGVVLACQSFVETDVRVEIPKETLAADRMEVDASAQRFRALHPGITRRPFARSPFVTKVFVQLTEPTLDCNQADCQRLQEALAKATGVQRMQMGLRVMRQLPALLRENHFAVTALLGARDGITEIVDVEGGDTSGRHFLTVVDVGTTTVVAHLVNLRQMATVDAVAGFNPQAVYAHLVDVLQMPITDAEACFNAQAVYGREVTARIIASEKRGPAALQDLIVGNINRLISVLAARNHINLKDVTGVVCTGNTAMMHFLLGLPASHIRRNPYIAATVEPPPLARGRGRPAHQPARPPLLCAGHQQLGRRRHHRRNPGDRPAGAQRNRNADRRRHQR